MKMLRYHRDFLDRAGCAPASAVDSSAARTTALGLLAAPASDRPRLVRFLQQCSALLRRLAQRIDAAAARLQCAHQGKAIGRDSGTTAPHLQHYSATADELAQLDAAWKKSVARSARHAGFASADELFAFLNGGPDAPSAASPITIVAPEARS